MLSVVRPKVVAVRWLVRLTHGWIHGSANTAASGGSGHPPFTPTARVIPGRRRQARRRASGSQRSKALSILGSWQTGSSA